MRGKVQLLFVIDEAQGITPAYAGKRNRIFRRGVVSRDHPRLCGEKQQVHIDLSACSGSPPPMRGKVCFTFDRGGLSGITPAYAGKRDKVYRAATPPEDHPRLCGEKFR